MKRILFTAFIVVGCCCAYSQVTLEDCQKWAKENYPLIKQYDLVSKSTDYTVSNAQHAWLPQLTFSAQAMYYSTVTEFPDEMSALYEKMGLDIHGLPRDQYKIALDLAQTIWDGGAVKAKTEIAKADGKAQEAQLASEIYSINERVSNLFFGTLLLQEQIRQNEVLQKLLQSNVERVEGAIDGGVAMTCDKQQLQAELLEAQQIRTKLDASATAYRTMLGILTAHSIDSLVMPLEPILNSSTNNRPELEAFAMQCKSLDAQVKAINASVCPTIGLFAQGYYGNPGMNLFKDMMQNQWTLNGYAGVRLQWSISNFYNRNNNLQKIQIAQQQLDVNREVFLYNLNLKNAEQNNAIRQMRQMLTQDADIIALRQSVREAYEVKLDNGVANVNDLLGKITDESKARIAEASHRIELLKYEYDLKNTNNN